MRKAALLMLVVSSFTAWGQTPQSSTPKTEKVDKATAYYHFMLAHMYAEMDSVLGNRTTEYAEKAAENYKLAVKADPQAPPLEAGPRSFLLYRNPTPRPNSAPTTVAPPKNP